MFTYLILIILPMAAWDDSTLPSPQSLFAQFQANKSSFGTLKLQWRRDAARTTEWQNNEQTQILALEKKLGDHDSSSVEYHKISQEIQNRKQVLVQQFSRRSMVQSYMTNRSKFLMLIAPLQWDIIHRGPDWLLPDVPLTEESLKTTFSGFTLVATGDYPNGGFAQATSLGTNGVSMMVRTVNFANYAEQYGYFPPLGIDQNKWGEDSLWHPIDLFFRTGSSGFSTVGRETIGGHETILIMHRSEAPSDKSQPVGIQRFEIVRAWLDPLRGALPLRIEWSFQDEAQGNAATQKAVGPNPWKVLETSEIVRVKNGGFYPSKGSIKTYGPSPERTDSAIPAITVPYAVVEEVTTWEAAKIEASLAENQSYKIPIAKGSYYYDETVGASLRSGFEDHNAAILPWSLCGAIVLCWLLYGFFVVLRRWKPRLVTKPTPA